MNKIYDEIDLQKIETQDKLLTLITDKLSLEYRDLTTDDLKEINKLRKEIHNLYKLALYINGNGMIDWSEYEDVE